VTLDEEPKVKQAAGVICLALAMAIVAVLLAGLALSIFHKSFEPWWLWLGGVLTMGAFGISARNSFPARRRVKTGKS
jgi:ABC-type Fe3+ transport system permease subunit